ncbi:MAG: radical SAM protein [Planktomarina sp.]|jgi:MoaA/NifB/PqqE/SkfB family radical SAM enzyme|nr:radical SAM protein [Planktomarina sp.]MDT2058311.1 radical SAM protein [Planktomarina sp.]MDT2072231.1 radical SAM protein [Planktomarina sp.]|tara:strand:- start:9429 stop:10379 length:951 start_codon:yes stop_codon:yes gene_type:complete
MGEKNVMANHNKFSNPFTTAKGDKRARVTLKNLRTLWFNTGTLCNIECVNCYINSSPKNDALVYITADEVSDFLTQLTTLNEPVQEIAFTGGEPFMNPEMIEIARRSLAAGYQVLILTNAMRPMMRKHMQQGLKELHAAYPKRLTLRVSLDHFTEVQHDIERGKGAFKKTLVGMHWLRDAGIRMAVAGRTFGGDTDSASRAGYQLLFARNNYNIDALSPAETVLFPELDEKVEVPEITTACWGILNKNPNDLMCASSRMVVKRKGANKPAVVACTLLPYATEFELGNTLEEAASDVALNHPHCAKFCVLGGASCST